MSSFTPFYNVQEDCLQGTYQCKELGVLDIAIISSKIETYCQENGRALLDTNVKVDIAYETIKSEYAFEAMKEIMQCSKTFFHVAKAL